MNVAEKRYLLNEVTREREMHAELVSEYEGRALAIVEGRVEAHADHLELIRRERYFQSGQVQACDWFLELLKDMHKEAS